MIELDTNYSDKLVVSGLRTVVDSASQDVEQYLDRHAIMKSP